ncbi:cyclic lactone autoinducer peptide [Desulforamulus reducens]|nr:cyclic lactone autoinducer peptide [Desulforamulus reducens]
MRIFKSLLLSLATVVFTLAAFMNAASACLIVHYQPELPNSLRKK